MYNEEQKKIARKEVIHTAIEKLTVKRSDSTLCPKDYIRRVKSFYKNESDDTRAFLVDKLSDSTIKRWEDFYSSIIHDKTASSLKIAYLSGPNPENDINEMTNLGILPENIWAFESDFKIYNEAVISALSSKFPFIKLIKSNIGDFFEVSPQKFDIIYLDFCGPLPSKKGGQKTLKTITTILKHHALTPLGVLITNVSLPSKTQNKEDHINLATLTADYLYPKSFLETNDPKWNCMDGAISHGFDPDKWRSEVADNIENYYGQYITRLLIDTISVISPYENFVSSHSLFKYMFKLGDKQSIQKKIDSLYHFDCDYNGGDVITDATFYPIMWTFAAINENYNKNDKNYSQHIYTNSSYNKFCLSFLSQLSRDNDANSLIRNISTMHFLMGEGWGEKDYYNESLIELSKFNWHKTLYPFCDLFLFHQVKEVLFRQLSVPYHVNTEQTQRWTYKAKDTQMYMDLFVLDECRYLYDWMPSFDMFYSGMQDVERQYSFRFILDAVAKHRMIYNNEFFFGTASVCRMEDGFLEKILKVRDEIL
ncbi:class I SAM-dependent methyltransferase [Proteus cibi]|uniref:class I SAM-dependent methyltransferase n=1 Tax=Proteus cibi TaxID=2050966 RepID=UPI0035A5FC48